MTRATMTLGVVARWTTSPRPAPGAICDECGAALHDTACGRCGQLGGRPIGMLATVIDSPAGVRLVIAERTPEGWVPVRTVPATATNVAALSRQGATDPAKATSTSGGLL